MEMAQHEHDLTMTNVNYSWGSPLAGPHSQMVRTVIFEQKFAHRIWLGVLKDDSFAEQAEEARLWVAAY